MNQRLSTLATWLLKRASRSAAHAAYRNAASQPILPSVPPSSFSDTSAQWYINSAGAMTQLLRPASTSYRPHNPLRVVVSSVDRPQQPLMIATLETATTEASAPPHDPATNATTPT